ncbi:unnamed protein product, partial [Brenthis ino]
MRCGTGGCQRRQMCRTAPSSGRTTSPGVRGPHRHFHPPSASVRRHAPPRSHVTTPAICHTPAARARFERSAYTTGS